VRAAVIGPGRVGCGFVGKVLRDSGHEVIFVARDARLAEHLNQAWTSRGEQLDRETFLAAAR